MKKLLILTFCSIVLYSSKCDKNKACPDNSHGHFKLQNLSNKALRCIVYWNYPDSLIGEYNPMNDGTDGVLLGESWTWGPGRGSCWEESLQNGKKQWLYIFDQDTISTLTWDVVQQTNRGLLERRLFDLEYLEHHNFNLTYP